MEIVILIGIQASGKTTFFRTHFANSHVHVSKDNFPGAKNRERRQEMMIREALADGLPVVVDNTNAARDHRTGVLLLAREYRVPVRGYYFDSTVQECLHRNGQRDGRQRVPDVAIFTVAKQLVPPHWDEGFDRLFKVWTHEGGMFVVEELTAQ